MIWCLLIEKVRTESVYLKMDLKPTRRWFKRYLYSDKSNIIAVGYVYNFFNSREQNSFATNTFLVSILPAFRN